MNIRVLGSASGFPVADRHASSYLLETKGNKILIDAGEGVSSQLQKYKVDVTAIKSVIITHTHPDHVAGLFLLLQWMFLEKRKKIFRIYLPQNAIKKFENILSWFYIIPDIWTFELDILPVTSGTFFEEENLQIKAIANTHLSIYKPFAEKYNLGMDAFSLWISAGNLIYTSDIKNLEHLNDIGGNIKVLLTEYTHISFDEILKFSKSQKINRVILTHIPPERENHSSENLEDLKTRNIEWAQDGTLIEV